MQSFRSLNNRFPSTTLAKDIRTSAKFLSTTIMGLFAVLMLAVPLTAQQSTSVTGECPAEQSLTRAPRSWSAPRLQ